jgi:Tol biopolymer transport system component
VFVHDYQTGQTQRISVSSGGQEGNGESGSPAISSTGRYIAFSSFASNLVSGDTNNGSDIFVMDRDTGVIQRVSVSSSEAQTAGGSHDPAISSNGRYIAFYSGAGDLVASDTNDKFDVFVRDTVAGRHGSFPSAPAGRKAITIHGAKCRFRATDVASALLPGPARSYPTIRTA